MDTQTAIEIIKLIVALATILLGGQIVLTGGALIVIASFLRAARKNPDIMAALKAILQGASAEVKVIFAESADIVNEADHLLDDLVGRDAQG